MNSACIIATCAASRHNREEHYAQYACLDATSDISVYYNVMVRKYFHFNSISITIPEIDCLAVRCGDNISKCDTFLKRVTLEPKTIAKQYSFCLPANKCKNGVDNYIKEHISEYENSTIWKLFDDEAINMYLDEVKRKYNIELDTSALDYNTQYCWEVESDVR